MRMVRSSPATRLLVPASTRTLHRRAACGVVILAKEERFPEHFALYHDKGQLQQRKERRLVRFEDFGKLRRDTVAASKMFRLGTIYL